MSQSESSGIEIHAQKPFILNIQKAECGNETAPRFCCVKIRVIYSLPRLKERQSELKAKP